ncbi:myosin light chain kinase 2, skeletal/cardiac muscle-like [Arapaima gigas]
MSSKAVSSLAKVFDSKCAPTVLKPGKLPTEHEVQTASFSFFQTRMESLSDKMDKLIHIQEKVLHKLDNLSQDIDNIERDMEMLKVDKEEIHLQPSKQQEARSTSDVKEMCQEITSIMSTVSQRSEQQATKLEGMERLMFSIQQAIGFIGETVKSSRVMELLFRGPGTRKSGRSSGTAKEHKGRDRTAHLNLKGLRPQRKKKPPDTPEIAALRKQAKLLEEVQRINQLNAERLEHLRPAQSQHQKEILLEDEVVPLPKAPQSSAVEQEESSGKEEQKETLKEENEEEEKQDTLVHTEQDNVKSEDKTQSIQVQEAQMESKVAGNQDEQTDLSTAQRHKLSHADQTVAECEPPAVEAPIQVAALILDSHEENVQTSTEAVSVANQITEVISCSKGHMSEEDMQKEEHKKNQVEVGQEKDQNGNIQVPPEMEQDKEESEVEDSGTDDDDHDVLEYFIDCSPPPPAPFNHRIVSAKPNQISSFYTINHQEILGGGRFGQVHKCIENSSGLTFAAKVIKAKSQKEKELVKNEILVMNQLDHANLIQLYAAYESRNDIILVLEYVDGGELFDRIIDENYKLTELDSVMFIRQICEGIQHMHKMYILHLDLKPENIMCVSRVTNKIKIIDFGLARKYQLKEKLKVNFGTPEFLAPEVINYDYVSFHTDMWSLGVITYMLLSSLSPFLGDDDNETLNNILACQWSFEEIEFTDISDEAKDFISKLLVINKSWRINASEALRHPWLSDPSLHHHLHEKKNMCRSRRSSCVPLCEM